MRNRYLFASLILLLAMANTTPALAQSVKDKNAYILRPYLAARQISTLEWELLQFNLLWLGRFDGSTNYVMSAQVILDKKMRFFTAFGLQEKRYHDDPEPFFSLPKPKRESILQGAVNSLIDLLSSSFPEVKSNPSLVYVEFWFRSNGSGRSVAAKYENGLLSFSE